MSNIDKLDKEISIDEISKNVANEESEFLQKMQELLKKNGEKQYGWLQYLNDEILKIIDNVDRRIHYWEDRRTQFLQIALGLLAASIAGIIAIMPEIQEILINRKTIVANLFYISLLPSLFVLIAGGIRIVWLWNLQNNPSYPFTKSFRVWRWQYRYAEQPGMEVNTNIQNDSKKELVQEARKFQANLMNYKNMTIDCDINELVNQNLSQLYLLITNEKYKIKFISKLRDSLLTFLKTSLIVFVVVFGLILINFIFSLIKSGLLI